MASQTDSLTESATQVDELVATLDSLIAGRPVAVFDWPEYPNAGDHFIWLGGKFILRHRLNVKVLYESGLSRIDFRQLTALPPQVVFVMHGGGNFGDLYFAHQRMREAIISAFPDRRIIMMPQTVMYKDPAHQERSARVLSLHPDLHVLARDQVSYETITGQMRLPNCYLHVDSAFALQPIVKSLVAAIAAPAERETLYLIRCDRESGAAFEDSVIGLDWSEKDDLAGFVDGCPSIEMIDIARDVFDTEPDAKSWGRLCAAIRLFGGARRIVTDRLHGHILALMMGKHHDLHDNNYGKNSTFCLTWTYRNPLVRFVDPPSRLRQAIADAGSSAYAAP